MSMESAITVALQEVRDLRKCLKKSQEQLTRVEKILLSLGQSQSGHGQAHEIKTSAAKRKLDFNDGVQKSPTGSSPHSKRKALKSVNQPSGHSTSEVGWLSARRATQSCKMPKGEKIEWSPLKAAIGPFNETHGHEQQRQQLVQAKLQNKGTTVCYECVDWFNTKGANESNCRHKQTTVITPEKLWDIGFPDSD